MQVINQLNITKVMISVAVLLAILILFINSIVFNKDIPDLLVDVKTDSIKPVLGFSLIDHNENKITSETFKGYWTFVFFGFTNCPDVCPATLSQLVQLNKRIEQKQYMAGKFRTLFVSVDPDRDGTKHIKEYVKYFNPGFVGATGKMKDILNFEKQFGAFHVIGDKSNENYTVGHTASVFLVNPGGVITAKFSPPMAISVVMQQIDMFMDRYAKM